MYQYRELPRPSNILRIELENQIIPYLDCVCQLYPIDNQSPTCCGDKGMYIDPASLVNAQCSEQLAE